MRDYFYPKLIAVEALEDYHLRTSWNTGETLDVSVLQPLQSHSDLAPILQLDVFKRVHLSEWGNSVEWFDEEFAADNLYAWAKEQAGEVSHQMFDDWMRRNQLSLTTAAEKLGMSRRMVGYYRTAQKAIPKTVWLACLGWESVQFFCPTEQLPRHLPTPFYQTPVLESQRIAQYC